jgi:hypothetical protein
VPDPATQEYLWWSQGARDEHDARAEGLNTKTTELVDVIENLAKGWGTTIEPRALLLMAARIYAPDVLRRRHRRD